MDLGKLSKEDYETLKAQYTREAVDCLRAMDELQMSRNSQAGPAEKDLKNEIEREISALRATGPVTAAEIFCAQCGQRISSTDRFCFECGTKLTIL